MDNTYAVKCVRLRGPDQRALKRGDGRTAGARVDVRKVLFDAALCAQGLRGG